MDIKVQAMGDYQTNCYIFTIDGKDIIIDPGVNALRWIDILIMYGQTKK